MDQNIATSTDKSDKAARLLSLSRELRILDDAAIGARQELDEIADLVVRSNPLAALPEPLASRLREATARVDDVDRRRRDLLVELDEDTPEPRCACGSLTLSTTASERHDRGLHSAVSCSAFRF